MSKMKTNVLIGVLTGLLIGFVFGAAFGTPDSSSLKTSSEKLSGNVTAIAPFSRHIQKDDSAADLEKEARGDTLKYEAYDSEGKTVEITIVKK